MIAKPKYEQAIPFDYQFNPENILIGSSQRPNLRSDCKAWRSARVVVAGNRTTFRNKEMCHEEIYRRSRVDLADRDPVTHRDCKRSPRVRSYHSPGITSTADARFRKPDSGPARGAFAAARDQRAVGAKPIWRGYVGAL